MAVKNSTVAAAAPVAAPKIVTVDMALLKERLAARAADPTTQKIGIAAGAAGLGALAYHLLAS